MNLSDFAVTREQARKLDTEAINGFGIPGLLLMENAGRACVREAERMLPRLAGSRVAVFCGEGNNGGDGFVIARHLSNHGAWVHAFLVGSIGAVLAKRTDASTNLQIALHMDVPVEEVGTEQQIREAAHTCRDCDLIVDALLGTGIKGEVRQPHLCAIECINDLALPVLAVDVPSGLDCDTGRPLGAAVRARKTVTFVLNKVGFTAESASEYTGEVVVAEISIPRVLIERNVTAWQRGGP